MQLPLVLGIVHVSMGLKNQPNLAQSPLLEAFEVNRIPGTARTRIRAGPVPVELYELIRLTNLDQSDEHVGEG